ncbi:CRISPR-associated helicase/endonuclease Cas3 [Candidimonas nitroreducens]|uniref:CRISPR-associated helicase/endonuclease Cas3 n=1 Tax=Candidimonas nitroreducens TaxID=683354 RepID=A0A225MS03_9BURK|nr:CRISPR-associated helicase/endonuclease Cas3 [Candidimonas nitroreducens]OWT64056.1 CRISPR-associated helicase/endonuclease Cas3 [Candidimonas nitroreducens]
MAIQAVQPTFYAHSTDDTTKRNWQPLRNHLVAVGAAAASKAAIFNAQDLAEPQGRLHDVGKYTHDYQRRIAGDAIRVDHATRGAMLAVERYKNSRIGYLLAYGIAGHHAGLANGSESAERTSLRDRLKGLGLPPLLEQWQQEITLPEHISLPSSLKARSRERSNFQLSFLVRMLFSCLVDADYLDTEAFYDQVEGRASARKASLPTLPALRDLLEEYLTSFKPDTPVNQIRASILRHVRDQAQLAPGLFSLTVPTGGGKTLASLAFALDHAIQHGLRRVIFVIPFTSIVEQNAAVFRTALSPLGDRAVLEHHSAFVAAPPPRDEPELYQAREKLRLSMENWDAPIVVTTAVQFFESLFAARPSACRKLHNIAGSVIILDEAQTLPLKVLRPCIAAIDELALNYRSSIVLCTATQPALQSPNFEGGLQNVREIASDPPELFRQLKRVRVRHIGTLDDAQLTGYLRARPQVLCIVNNRRHARAVYQSLADLPGARHLSTLMCARHRSAVLSEIRAMLKRGEACRLAATSLVEAGVDISLPTVLRAEAGLDSIAQAAGRCNRNGEWAAENSEVLIFAPADEGWAPPPELRQFAQAAREILRQHGADPLSPEAIKAYFQHLYWQKGSKELDANDLLGMLQASGIDSLPMETLATRFRMIDSAQMPVIVPYDKEARDMINKLRHAEKSGGLARALQPYLIQVPRQGFDALRNAGAVQPIAFDKWGEQFMELVNMDIYSEQFGLWWEDPTFVKIASMMI